ncbi:MAG: YedE-related selenium metabolism membrane protein [Spirochaetia bacterium]|nr:YedE-related selenium metabolism membrane protein [Spirochaetia bacterium]
MDKERRWLGYTGLAIGLAALILVANGNPKNMGFCIACFIRDITGSLGLHQAAKLQYARPEIFGLILGSFLLSSFRREWRPTGGSSMVVRFFLGFFMMAGALVFLGCPLRMVLRLGGGDGKAIFALIGFSAGIWLGTRFLNSGFTLGRAYKQTKVEGSLFPIVSVLMLILCLFGLIGDAKAATHAPFFLSLILALVCGAFAQRTRFCMVGGIRDMILFKDSHLFTGSLVLFVTVLIGNIILGNFKFSITAVDAIWYALSMGLVGLCGALLGGCPLRQLILTGEGNTDSAITVLGMVMGAAISHNFTLASSAKGVTAGGKVEVIIGLALAVILGLVVISKQKKEALA